MLQVTSRDVIHSFWAPNRHGKRNLIPAERLGLSDRFGRHQKKLVARWDQIDIRRPERLVLTCVPEDLKSE